MLLLTRLPGQVITIGDDIKITIVKVNGRDKVRVGIDAPKYIKILRKEVKDVQGNHRS